MCVQNCSKEGNFFSSLLRFPCLPTPILSYHAVYCASIGDINKPERERCLELKWIQSYWI